nr:unnamed protein product [Spirometra erinaceieuropaei]
MDTEAFDALQELSSILNTVMRWSAWRIDRNSDTLTTPGTSTRPSPTLAPLPCAPITTTITASSVADTDAADITCPHCSRTFTSRIGLVGHLRIHRTETGEPVPGAPTYTHQARLNCPHCPRTFRHRMSLFGHRRIHESGTDRTPDTPTTSNVRTPTPAPSTQVGSVQLDSVSMRPRLHG